MTLENKYDVGKDIYSAAFSKSERPRTFADISQLMNFNGYKIVTDDQEKVYPNTILIKKAIII